MNEWMKSKAQIMLLLTNKEKAQGFKNNQLSKDSCYVHQRKDMKSWYFENHKAYIALLLQINAYSISCLKYFSL